MKLTPFDLLTLNYSFKSAKIPIPPPKKSKICPLICINTATVQHEQNSVELINIPLPVSIVSVSVSDSSSLLSLSSDGSVSYSDSDVGSTFVVRLVSSSVSNP